MTDKNTLTVSKSNPILSMKNDMGLYLNRLFNLYLAKINPLLEDTKKVQITLTEFVQLLDITEVSPKKLHKLAQDAIKMGVDLYALENKDGKKSVTNRMNYVNIWRRFKIDQDDNGEWFVELEAHEDVLPYMFDLKELGYLNFPVIYALRMRSNIAEKLYEQCARYKRMKKFKISPEDLKERLGVSEKASYRSYNKFKTVLLARCIKEINENTDLHVEIIGEERRRIRGAPVHNIVFSVESNAKYKKQKADADIEKICEKKLPIDVEMTTVDVMAEKIGQDAAAALSGVLREYGMDDSEIKTVLLDQKNLSLTDDRVVEVVKYVHAQKWKNRIGYIRSMLRQKNADLKIVTEEEKARVKASANQFNQFEHNKYDFDKLETELLGGDSLGEADTVEEWESKKTANKPEEKSKSGLPLYYIVLGRPDVQDRLAAYASMGITEIVLLSEDEYNRLK